MNRYINPAFFRKSEKARTFQEIYDFCLLNNNYRTYFKIPNEFEIKDKRKYIYYYRELNKGRGQSRKGSYIYTQSMNELMRFMGNTTHNFYIHIDLWTYSFVEREDENFDNMNIFYVTTSITEKGVRISFTDPFGKSHEKYTFYPRSHNFYNKRGLVKEVKSFVEKNLLFPAGRWRNLQTYYGVKKEKFVEWYREIYKKAENRKNESDYYDMIEKYTPKKEYIDYNDAEEMLSAVGFFSDFGIEDEFSRDETVWEFMQICNK